MPQDRTNRDRMPEFALLWGKAQPSVTAYVRSIVLNHHDAEDVIQATVTYLVDHFEDYDPARPFVAWAIGIARYRILHYRDQNQRKPLLLEEDALEALSSVMASEADQMDDRLEALEHCIGRLSEKHQQILSKRYREQAKRKDIAQAFGLRENSVSVLLRRVRSALEECVTRRMGGTPS